MLNLKHLPKKHTYKYIQNAILHCLQLWDIHTETPAFITTDNGRNIVKAIDNYNKWSRVPCFSHCLQLAVKQGLENF